MLAGIFVVVYCLWNTSLVYPLKILVVFFHEISHGVAAVLTGGSIGPSGVLLSSHQIDHCPVLASNDRAATPR